MKALIILIHTWSPFLPLSCLHGKKITFMGLCVAFCPDYPCKWHDHDHKWADFTKLFLSNIKNHGENDIQWPISL